MIKKFNRTLGEKIRYILGWEYTYYSRGDMLVVHVRKGKKNEKKKEIHETFSHLKYYYKKYLKTGRIIKINSSLSTK